MDPQQDANKINPSAQPLPSPPDLGRSKEFKRVAAMGQKRTEKEKAIKDKIREDRETVEKESHESLEKSIHAKEASTGKKKEYRVMMQTREQELAEDHQRRAKQDQLIINTQKVRDTRRKQQQGYMQELHETSLVKQAMEKRQNQLKSDKERERTKAEYNHRTKMDAATHADTARKKALEHEAMSRKALIDADIKNSEYQLETGKRSRLAQVENESLRQFALSVSGHLPAQAGQLRAAADMQLRVKHKQVEHEWAERKAALEQAAERHKSEIDNDAYARKAQSESELRRITHQIDNERTQTLEAIEQKYREFLSDNRS